eukprot:COSAG06_NODE_1426_length_9494_cov_8.250985_1_plen_55_part_00
MLHSCPFDSGAIFSRPIEFFQPQAGLLLSLKAAALARLGARQHRAPTACPWTPR